MKTSLALLSLLFVGLSNVQAQTSGASSSASGSIDPGGLLSQQSSPVSSPTSALTSSRSVVGVSVLNLTSTDTSTILTTTSISSPTTVLTTSAPSVRTTVGSSTTRSGGPTLTTSSAATSNAAASDRIGTAGTLAGFFALLAAAAF
ncbi:hypothetical protein AX15_001230 [Amanita polypyramis BW_CC]|nr:hypothetical protein AX15_001230 [Amanita polypyramis BW_CC]